MAALADRQRFRTLSGYVPKDMATPEAQAMMQWFGVYFSTFADHERVDVDQLVWLIRQRTQGADPAAVALTLQYAELLRQPMDETAVRGAVSTLCDLDFVGRAGSILARYEAGEDIDPVYMLELLARDAKRAKSNGKADDFERSSIGDILSELSNDRGLKFNFLPGLADSIAGLQGGASVAIGARPDKGKTSAIAAILADWARQCVELFGPARPILWLNNEGTAKRIKPRIYQAALKMTLEEIMALSNQGKLEAAYLESLGIPDLDYIRIKNIHGASMAQIEQIIEDMQPSVVVYDMLANVRVPTAVGGNKADAVELAWQLVRENAVRYDHVALSTVQLSVEGNDQLWPDYSALKDSKTGVQGATDIIMLMGAMNDPRLAALRGFATPKNKFAKSGKPSHAQVQALFDGARCVFHQTEGTDAHPTVNEGPVLAAGQAQVAVPGNR